MHVTSLPSRRADAGFTLIELLVSITILGLIAFPLANTVIGVMLNMDSSSARMSASHSAQMSTTYFAQDVETVGVRDYTANNAPTKTSILLSGNAGSTCGASGTAALVRFLSDSHDTSTSPATLRSAVVSWAVVSTPGDSQLVRTRCVDGSTLAQITVAHNLSLSPAPTLTCSSTCNASAVPQSVTLAFTVAPPEADPYAVTLIGGRRQT
jgi:prepilin-type N-terminal cleavage/methylation domain-containing protein